MKQVRLAAILASILVSGTIGGAAAQEVSTESDLTADELIEKLAPKEGEGDIDYKGVPQRTYRGLAISSDEAEAGEAETGDTPEGQAGDRPQRDLPTVALDIQFALDSAELTDQARRQLTEFARAMTSERLARYRFLLEGHTDSRGPKDYNKRLSERRAASVRRYLVQVHGIDADRLSTRGHGERFPLDADDPRAAVNRRVEITNVGRPTAADADPDAGDSPGT